MTRQLGACAQGDGATQIPRTTCSGSHDELSSFEQRGACEAEAVAGDGEGVATLLAQRARATQGRAVGLRVATQQHQRTIQRDIALQVAPRAPVANLQGGAVGDSGRAGVVGLSRQHGGTAVHVDRA